MLECVINVSEGRDAELLSQLARSCGAPLLDVHTDPDHHRSVFTLGGENEAVLDASFALAAHAMEVLDLSQHEGVHPRVGVVDVVPFVPLHLGRTNEHAVELDEAIAARGAFVAWATEHGLHCALYGDDLLSLPELRRRLSGGQRPDALARAPRERAGIACVGARDVLVAWNIWVEGTTRFELLSTAASMRRPGLRTLALELGRSGHSRPAPLQLSCNVTSPFELRLDHLYDEAQAALPQGARAVGAELVGLLPHGVLSQVPSQRWAELGLSESATIEARLALAS